MIEDVQKLIDQIKRLVEKVENLEIITKELDRATKELKRSNEELKRERSININFPQTPQRPQENTHPLPVWPDPGTNLGPLHYHGNIPCRNNPCVWC